MLRCANMDNLPSSVANNRLSQLDNVMVERRYPESTLRIGAAIRMVDGLWIVDDYYHNRNLIVLRRYYGGEYQYRELYVKSDTFIDVDGNTCVTWSFA